MRRGGYRRSGACGDHERHYAHSPTLAPPRPPLWIESRFQCQRYAVLDGYEPVGQYHNLDVDMEVSMRPLEKKTTILFSTEEYLRLKDAARIRRCSVGELIRRTLREQSLLVDPQDKDAAVDALAEMSLPVGSWEELEEETLRGATT